MMYVNWILKLMEEKYMALISCPDCKKRISSRVEACPFCGCPAQFFNIDDKEDLEQVAEPTAINVIEKKMVSFNINSHAFSYPVDSTEFAFRAGLYFCSADRVYKEIGNAYDTCDNISSIFEEFPNKVSLVMETLINGSAKFLYEKNIFITPEELWNKYNEKYCMEFPLYCTNIINKYTEILRVKEEMKNIRNQIKQSRGRWQGGGFGVKGAIKGAVTASMLNAGSDFLHSFGDMARKSRDNNEIQNRLRALYKDNVTRETFCKAAYSCVMSVFYAERDELIESGYFKEIINIDKKQADDLFQLAHKYGENRTDKTEKILSCIECFPGDSRFYEEIIDELVGQEDEVCAFFKFWNIEAMMSDYIQRLRKRTKCANYIASINKRGGLLNYTVSGVIDTIQAVDTLSEEDVNCLTEEEFKEVMNGFFLNSQFDHQIWKDIKLVLYAVKDKGYINFLKEIRKNQYIFGIKVFNDIWLAGDALLESDDVQKGKRGTFLGKGPDKRILEITGTGLDHDPRMLIYYRDDSSDNVKGYCVTEHYVMDLETLHIIPNRKIVSITPRILENKTAILEISDGSYAIKIGNPKWKGEESGIAYLANVLRILLVKYLGNNRLWTSDLNIAKPDPMREELPDEVTDALEYAIRKDLYGDNDWRSIKINKEKVAAFREKFIEALGQTHLRKYLVDEITCQLTNKVFVDKFRYFCGIYPNEPILFVYNDDINVTGSFLNWRRTFVLDDIRDLWVEQSIKGLHLKIVVGQEETTYTFKCNMENKELVPVIRYALGKSSSIEDAEVDAYKILYTDIEKYIARNYNLSKLDLAVSYYKEWTGVNEEEALRNVNTIFQKATEMRNVLEEIGEDMPISYKDVILEERVFSGKTGGVLKLDEEGISYISDEATQSVYIEIRNIKKVDQLQTGSSHCFRISVKNKFFLYTFETSDDNLWVKTTERLIEAKNRMPTSSNERDVHGKKDEKEVTNQTATVYCPFCGNKIRRSSKFCNFCGKLNKYVN